MVGQLEPALALPVRPGKGAPFMAEELAFDETFRNGRAVDLDQGGAHPLGQPVDLRGDKLLAGAAFPGDQHRGVAGRHLGEHFVDRAHGVAGPHYLAPGNDTPALIPVDPLLRRASPGLVKPELFLGDPLPELGGVRNNGRNLL